MTWLQLGPLSILLMLSVLPVPISKVYPVSLESETELWLWQSLEWNGIHTASSLAETLYHWHSAEGLRWGSLQPSLGRVWYHWSWRCGHRNWLRTWRTHICPYFVLICPHLLLSWSLCKTPRRFLSCSSINAKRKALVASQANMGSECGDKTTFWCQFVLMIPWGKIPCTEMSCTVKTSCEMIYGRHKVFLSLYRFICLSNVNTSSHFSRFLGYKNNWTYPRCGALQFFRWCLIFLASKALVQHLHEHEKESCGAAVVWV